MNGNSLNKFMFTKSKISHFSAPMLANQTVCYLQEYRIAANMVPNDSLYSHVLSYLICI